MTTSSVSYEETALKRALANGKNFASAQDFYEKALRGKSFFVVDEEPDETTKAWMEGMRLDQQDEMVRIQTAYASAWKAA